MTPQVWWLLARASGLVAYALLTASVLAGLLLAVRVRRLPPAAWLLDLHRFLGGIAVVFTGVHLLAILLDDFVQFRLVDLVVPFASSWRPAAVAWGVLAFHLLVAVEVTSLLRSRLSRRVWRAVHLTSFPAWALASVHLVTAGSDAASWPVRMLLVVAVAAVAAVGMWRFRGAAVAESAERGKRVRR